MHFLYFKYSEREVCHEQIEQKVDVATKVLLKGNIVCPEMSFNEIKKKKNRHIYSPSIVFQNKKIHLARFLYLLPVMYKPCEHYANVSQVVSSMCEIPVSPLEGRQLHPD